MEAWRSPKMNERALLPGPLGSPAGWTSTGALNLDLTTQNAKLMQQPRFLTQPKSIREQAHYFSPWTGVCTKSLQKRFLLSAVDVLSWPLMRPG